MSERKPYEQIKAEHDAFLRQFANTVLAWQQIEESLFNIFNLLLRSPEYAGTSAAFHSIINTRARLDVVEAAAKAILDVKDKELSELYKDWKALAKDIRKNASKRNAMAHSMMFFHTDISALKATVPHDTTYLRRSIQDALSKPEDEYDLKRMKETHQIFDKIYTDSVIFVDKLIGKFGHDYENIRNGKART